jgi:hypothetical protein
MARKKSKIQRKLNPRVLIFCEGETEKLYLIGLKNSLPRTIRSSLKIIIDCPSRSHPKELLEEAKNKIISNDFEGIESYVWLVCDRDDHKHLKYTFEESKKRNFDIAFSNICIEIWFLLHFQENPALFSNCSEAKSYLRKFIDGYHETFPRIYEKLKDLESTAIKNSEKLYAMKQGDLKNGIYNYEWELNPYTTMHKLIKFLRSFK